MSKEERTREIRAVLPAAVHAELRHLGLDLDRTLAELLVDAAVLLCRHHGRSVTLPEPLDPTSATAR